MKTIALQSPTGVWLEVTHVASKGSNQEVYWKQWKDSTKPEGQFDTVLTGSTHTGTLDELLDLTADPGLTIAENAIQAGYIALMAMPELFDGWEAVAV